MVPTFDPNIVQAIEQLEACHNEVIRQLAARYHKKAETIETHLTTKIQAIEKIKPISRLNQLKLQRYQEALDEFSKHEDILDKLNTTSNDIDDKLDHFLSISVFELRANELRKTIATPDSEHSERSLLQRIVKLSLDISKFQSENPGYRETNQIQRRLNAMHRFSKKKIAQEFRGQYQRQIESLSKKSSTSETKRQEDCTQTKRSRFD